MCEQGCLSRKERRISRRCAKTAKAHLEKKSYQIFLVPGSTLEWMGFSPTWIYSNDAELCKLPR